MNPAESSSLATIICCHPAGRLAMFFDEAEAREHASCFVEECDRGHRAHSAGEGTGATMRGE